jgi:cytochrome c oxidase subunit 3
MSGSSATFPFPSRHDQKEAYRQGGWVFLISEFMLFGGLFLAYLIGRIAHPAGFAEGSAEMDLALGTINTAILLTSSWTMALAVHSGQQKKPRVASRYLVLTAVLGLAFLGIKGIEWLNEIGKGEIPGRAFLGGGAAEAGKGMFLWFYFTATGLHALHLTLGVLTILIFAALYRRRPPQIPEYLLILGLYWHLVDIIWIFLFPLLYLVGGPR